MMALPTTKPFLVRGKITFALEIDAEDARDASLQVRDALNRLSSVQGIRDAYEIAPTVHEWEVLPEQIERSE